MIEGHRKLLVGMLAPTLLVGFGAAVGCRSPRMMARALPSEYRATPGAGMQRVRLGGFTSAEVSSKSIGADDLLTIQIATGLLGEAPIEHKARVARDGAVDTPLIGRVTVVGLEPAEAADQIASAATARGVYVRPQISVEVTEQATNSITVLGAVGEPGVKELPRSGCDVLTAIAAAGGLNEDAGAVVELLRGGSLALADSETPGPSAGVKQVSYDGPATRKGAELIDLAKPEAVSPDRMRLADHDILIVRPKQKRVVHVTGLVKNPNQFELMEDHDLRVLDAIAMAGGAVTSMADKVLVVRQSPENDEPLVVEVSISHAKNDGSENLILQSGDLVSVESTPATVAVEAVKNVFRISMGVGGNLSLF
ncbi:Polysaccharide biosynthesis/export protein [Botrimarina colliarenosi]|uniref:Polysaccharide biosynthesis/export protein n=1 Tax=Botrimarina colliarenosi TaxID=2528001 RepID=A0A5C6AJC1_9BACT|nr:SLBB domain-containing protein [Botrimarina colliarenosi]TWT99500.1 Polysaccharide biosynthesis/export protein [Botrimarina colliarenosi]